MSLRYVIKYTWPSGKVRYRTDAGLAVDIEDATIYSLHEASTHIRNSTTARIVWDIQTCKVKV